MTDHDTELAIDRELAEYCVGPVNGHPNSDIVVEKIIDALRSVRQEAEKKVIKEIEEGTRKVFGDGTKGPWKTLLDKVRQEENEACAKVASEYHYGKLGTVGVQEASEEMATAIRNRMKEKP